MFKKTSDHEHRWFTYQTKYEFELVEGDAPDGHDLTYRRVEYAWCICQTCPETPVVKKVRVGVDE